MGGAGLMPLCSAPQWTSPFCDREGRKTGRREHWAAPVRPPERPHPHASLTENRPSLSYSTVPPPDSLRPPVSLATASDLTRL